MVVECILKSVGAAVADLQLPMQSVPITINEKEQRLVGSESE
jgi:hypothetical protein